MRIWRYLVLGIVTYELGVYTELHYKEVEMETQIMEVPIHDTLNDWQVFTMAMIEVESEFDSIACRTDTDAWGILQITPIFIKECNRKYGTNYTHQDALNPTLALEMFELMNPQKDIKLAIQRHNPNAGKWYANRVYKAMEKIRRQEEIRAIIIQDTMR